jgi:hypothetical protein
MARRKWNWLAARVSVLALPLAASCVDDAVSLRVECAIIPETDDTGCVFDPAGSCLIEGRMNVAPGAATYYQGAVRVTNALKARARDIPVQSETNGIAITEFEVEVLNTAGGRITFDGLPNPFTIQTSGFIPVGGSGIAAGEFLPTGYVNQIRVAEGSDNPLGQVVVSLIVRGKTQGDVEVETAAWQWPIRLFSISVTDRSVCTVFDDAVCNIGQDTFVSACANQSPAP